MYNAVASARARFALSAGRAVGTALLLLISATGGVAQISPTDSTTPTGMAHGSPAGSYSLGGFDNVNLFSGNLNFSLPLLNIGGRGGRAWL